jgi:hypothetical protein
MRSISSKVMSLLSERETQLVLASAPRNLSELSTRELRSRLTRTRRLMDKYEAQARSQRQEARGKREPSGARRVEGDLNTRRKAEFFKQVLKRFEDRLSQLERPEPTRSRSAGRAAGARSARAAPEKRVRTAGGAQPAAKPAATLSRKAAKPAAAGLTRRASPRGKGGALKQQRFPSINRQAHGSSRGRRIQARRDRR